MRTFFYIFHLFRQCHCHKQQFFFSILFKFISTFFSPQFQQWHCHKLCTFFCFCLQHFKIRISYLCLESTYFFFLFLFTSLQNKNLYLSLQCVSQNKNIVLEITLPVYQDTFTIKQRDQPNYFGERLTTFFYISPIFRQSHCYKPIATIFFFYSILFKFIPTFIFFKK